MAIPLLQMRSDQGGRPSSRSVALPLAERPVRQREPNNHPLRVIAFLFYHAWRMIQIGL
ncbi:hypothetical protein ACH4TV_13155 [Streptomyces sp. NPDC020898]|uniref:hypothetical protein n=1 Tax=Streptomyces sp. NPDC020898 TaxID=3365101 RepID=UPI00378B51FA